MDRKKELEKIVYEKDANNQILYGDLIEHILFLEDNMRELKELPFIKVNPNNKAQQKATPASKQYKEFLQQYINCIKVLGRATGQDMDNEESPLRKWVKGHVNTE